jgi:hypothetical protein
MADYPPPPRRGRSRWHLLERIGQHDVRVERPRQRVVVFFIGAIFPECGQDVRAVAAFEFGDEAQERGRAGERGGERGHKPQPGIVSVVVRLLAFGLCGCEARRVLKQVADFAHRHSEGGPRLPPLLDRREDRVGRLGR